MIRDVLLWIAAGLGACGLLGYGSLLVGLVRDSLWDRKLKRRAEHLADLGRGYPRVSYTVGTHVGTGVEWRGIVSTWPEVVAWAEETSLRPRVVDAFVVGAEADRTDLIAEWTWKDGAMVGKEIRVPRA
ncbi:hypothetical protein [Planomonospora sp. ID82291]|uniref:hypothetical protein n=1 Tax=Planomonospora sp. ID82291 TaxID=2738136 RepID=UPI0018C3A655|nr:hypothetical protein [Planomonospora sp. ID82291]MBG0819110.1 hypothetical protein [Planomonospora sp. ID82291]